MTTIDNRVVKMGFDNAVFEKNANTSIHTLEKLKQSLNFTGAVKGLDNLEAKSKSINMDALAKGVETVADKFNALGVVGFTVLQNLTNRAVDAGARIASALTIDPIKMGFQEYETQINAVQTILANTQDKLKAQGLDDQQRLDLVNEKLDELNTYADKTIYNFTEMTRNIGTFTAAGVDLETATNAIQGIANLAAISGSNSQQASTAMYQLSQALASGTVKLMDWNSVVNAGMGGEVFQKELKETARAHGIAIDDIIEKNGSFRESLQEGWLTADILTETLEKFTATTEGLTDAEIEQQRAMWRSRGYTEEQIDAIFELGKMSTDAATKVKTFTQLIDTLKEALQSGWTQSWEYIIGDFEEAKELWTSISDVLGGYISDSANARNAVLKEWSEAEGGRKAVIEGLKNAFYALVNVIGIVKDAFREVFPAVTAQQLIDISSKFRDLAVSISTTIAAVAETKKVQTGLVGIFSIIKAVATFIGRNLLAALNALRNIIKAILPSGDTMLDSFAGFGELLSYLAEKINSASTIADGILKLGEVIAEFIEKAKEFLKLDELGEKFGNFVNILRNGGGSGDLGIFDRIGQMFDNIKGVFDQVVPKIVEKLNMVREALANFVRGAKDELGRYGGLDIIGALGLGAGGFGLTKIAGILKKVEDVVGDVSGWKDNLLEIKDALIDTFGAIQQNLKADALKSIAVAIGILAASLFVISLIDTEKLLGSLAALSALMWEVNWMLDNLSGIKGKARNMIGAASLLIGMAVAIGVLAVAMRIIGGMDVIDIMEGMAAVIVLITVLTEVAKKMSEYQDGMKRGSSALIRMALAIALLAISVRILGGMDLGSLAKGLLSVITLIGALIASVKIMSETEGDLNKVARNIMAIAIALILLTIPVKVLGGMDLGSLAKGLFGVIALIFSLVIALNTIPKDVSAKVSGLMALAVAVAIMGSAVKVLGEMNLIDLAKGLASVAVMLLMLSVAAKKMNTDLVGVSGIVALSGALILMAVALKILSTIPILKLVASLGAIVAVFFLLGVAAEVLAPLAPALIAVGVAMLAFGAAIALLGAGLLMLSIAITTSGTLILGFIANLIMMIPTLGTMFAKMVGNFITAIGEQIPAIVEVVISLLNSLLQSILEYVPQMANAVLQIILGILQAVAENIQQIVEAGMAIVIGFINGISAELPELIDAAFKLIISFIDGLATAIDENHDALYEAVRHLIQSIVNAILDLVFMVGGAAGNLIVGEGGILQALGNGVQQLFDAGANLVRGFIDGITSMPGALWDAACGLANAAWNAITSTLNEHSPSRLTFGGGANFTQGFINGILSLKSRAADSSASVAYAAMDAFDTAIDTDYTPTITPVMDLTNIQNGIGQMGGMLDALPSTYGIDGSLDAQKFMNNQALAMLGSGSDYSSILNGMMGLRDDLSKYNEMLSKLQIVMDTGTVVGALTPGIDRQLGRNAILAGRGVV